MPMPTFCRVLIFALGILNFTYAKFSATAPKIEDLIVEFKFADMFLVD